MEVMTMHPTTKDNCLPADFTRTIPNRDPAQAQAVPLVRLKHNPYQPRNKDYREDLDEFVESVRQYGILQPILIRQIAPDEYELIAGERRVSAAHRAGLTSIPAIICDVTDQESAEIALIENLQREDLSPVEMARAFRALMDDFKLTQQELSKRVGKSQSTISELVRLLALPDTMLSSLEGGEIQERHARALLRIADETLREQVYQRVIAEHLTVHQTEYIIRNALGKVSKSRKAEDLPPPAPSPETSPPQENSIQPVETSITRLEMQLMQLFQRRVIIRCPDVGCGRIEIAFYDTADGIRLANRLLAASVAE
jgi:ParB family transcriptional regulator, chromosome partitioning protein